MKLLLVTTNREMTPIPVLPLGACLVASSLSETGRHEVRVLDLLFSSDPAGDLRQTLSTYRPEVVGLSIRNIDNVDYLTPVFYFEELENMVMAPLKAYGDALIVAGGPGFSIEPESILRSLGIRFGVVGDGEKAMTEFLDLLAGNDDRYDSVAGLAWIDEQGGYHENPRAFPTDLDTLPFSRPWQWLDLKKYGAYGGALSLQSKRGCALGCTYCVYNTIEGRSYRLRSPRSITAELEEAAGRTRLRDVDFTDSTFNGPLEPAKELLEALTRLRADFHFQTSGINPGFVDRELTELLTRAGFGAVMITAESACNATLAGMRKGYTEEDVHRAASLFRDLPMKVFWYFLLGGPGETEETARRTLQFIHEHIPPHHLVYFGVGIRIQRGAPLEALAKDQGLLEKDAPLLSPRFYFSPELDPRRLIRMVGTETLTHANYLQNIDYQGGRGPVILARFFRFLGLVQPSWSFVPTLFRLFPFARKSSRFQRKEAWRGRDDCLAP